MTTNLKQLGIVEGFYGKPWSFAKRKAYIPFMQEHGYSFYLYAPKADRFLREDWREPVPEALLEKLKELGKQLQGANIQWAIGLSPFDLHQDFNEQAKSDLESKLAQIESLGVNWLAILFDDMRGDFPDLAQRQLEICHFIRDNFTRHHSQIEKLLMCPSYYSLDPILGEVFGEMPNSYLDDLGKGLDQSIDIFWTGEKVCSDHYSLSHLKNMESILKRKPFIWDNYPVNDGARMSPFLHLSQSSSREYCNNNTIAGLAVNPMNEAFLSQIPLAGISHTFGYGSYVSLDAASDSSSVKEFDANEFEAWCDCFLSKASDAFKSDRHLFEDVGFHNLDEAVKMALIEKYEKLRDTHNQDFIEELVDYLKGYYISDVNDLVPTQLLWQD